MRDACITLSHGKHFPCYQLLSRLNLSIGHSPGWEGFLEDMAEKYEMHVYTMGTRAYAEEVCAAIDPDGKIFGGRLLSRDESGSESTTFPIHLKAVLTEVGRLNAEEFTTSLPM